MERFKKFHKEIPSDDSTSEGEKMILYSLIRELKPEVVIETGTHRGLTSVYLAQALLDNNKGSLYTCDPNDEWGQNGNFRKFPEFNTIITFFNQMGKEMLKHFRDGKIDFAFIDGFHGKHDVIPEIKALLPKLSENAVVVFHDCWPLNESDGVNEACAEMGLHSVWLPTKNAIRIYCKKVF